MPVDPRAQGHGLEFKSKFLSGKKEGGIFPDKILKMGS
jgi:hypothetical protein